jgi:hypothetical protein
MKPPSQQKASREGAVVAEVDGSGRAAKQATLNEACRHSQEKASGQHQRLEKAVTAKGHSKKS